MPEQISLGVTGTRRGMTIKQERAFRKFARQYYGWFHYGCCVGVDVEAAKIACEIGGYHLVCHPPEIDKYRSFWEPPLDVQLIMHPAKPYADRDLDIVLASDRMVAVPKGFTEERRGSGTWLTVRLTRAEGVPLTIIYPDGSMGK